MADGLQIEVDTNFQLECLAPEGTGLGEGNISRKNRLASGEITETDLAKAHEAIHDPTYYPPVEFGDDGCGDGRGTLTVFRVKRDKSADPENPNSNMMPKEYFERSGHRSKVFGGGLNIGWAMRRVIQGVPKIGDTLINDRLLVAQELDQRGLEFGGHIGSHAHGGNIGCGALDETVPIIGLAVKYQDKLHALVKQLKGDNFDDEAFARTMEVFGSIADNPKYTEGASGQSALQVLDLYGAVIKELGGDHNEVIYLRNHVPGTTFNQSRINAESGGRTQVFADDVWRRDIYAAELGGGKDELTRIADTAGEVITLATTIALTDGSQEVYRRTAA